MIMLLAGIPGISQSGLTNRVLLILKNKGTREIERGGGEEDTGREGT